MKRSSVSSTVSKSGVGVYIFSENGTKVLLSQRGQGSRHEHFRLEGPGGALNPGETFQQAAHREIQEELGIEIILGPIIGSFRDVMDSNGDSWHNKIFSATTADGPQVMEPAKCVGFGWFTRQEVAHLNLADYAVKDMHTIGWL